MRIAVGMSGGVDSAVTAALLQATGHEVIGVSLFLWRGSECCSAEALVDARCAARTLGIPHYVFEARSLFQREIVAPFIQESLRGLTPNPCPLCNARIKFGHLWHLIRREFQADGLATGHYARLAYNPETGRFQLFRGSDPAKDQSYMLFGLTQEQLSRAWFPLGGCTKQEVRQMARDFQLTTVADKPDSQDLCFSGGNMAAFWAQQELPQVRRGPIVNRQGQTLGEHRGLVHYTVGQRRGLGVASPQPQYVLAIDAANNRLVVGPQAESTTLGLLAENVNWLSIPPPRAPRRADVKIRYRSQAIPAAIEPGQDESVRVVFDDPQQAVTPGQAVVFYDARGMVLGGGQIKQAL